MQVTSTSYLHPVNNSLKKSTLAKESSLRTGNACQLLQDSYRHKLIYFRTSGKQAIEHKTMYFALHST